MYDAIDCSQERIIRYIDHLKSNYGLNLSIHLSSEYSFITPSIEKLYRYNIHANPYCFHVKNSRSENQKCLLCQKELHQRCKHTENFLTPCHADVYQYIHRITSNNAAVGFVCVSGYQNPEHPPKDDEWYYTYLSAEEPPLDLLDVVIPPLVLMLSVLFTKCLPIPKENVYVRMLNYLDMNHNATLEQISRDLGYSKSYISHMFRRESGYTLKAYCNQLKIKDAEILLKTTDLSITDVALTAGFNNFSYFISTFKQIHQVTPSVWRKKRDCIG